MIRGIISLNTVFDKKFVFLNLMHVHKNILSLKRIILIILLLCNALWINAQDQKADSLKSVIETLREDSTKVKALNELSFLLWDTKPDISIMYAMEAMELANKIDFKKGVAYALKNIGIAYFAKSDYISVFEYWEQSLAVFDSIGDMNGVSNILNNIGSVYFEQGDDASAVEYFIRAIKIAEDSGNKLRMASAYLNIGTLYSNKVDTQEKAKEYFSLALKIAEELNLYDMLGTTAVNIGEYYYDMNEYDSALIYYDMSLKAFEIDGSGTIPYTLNNIGILHATRGEYPSAIKFHEDAYAISKQNKDKKQMAQSLIGLGNAYKLSNDFQSSLKPFLEAEEIGKEIGINKELQEVYQGLSIVYSELQDYTNAFRYQTLLTEINYELYNAENDKKIEKMQFTYEIDKQKVQINLLTAETALQEAEVKRQKMFRNAMLVGLVLIVIIAVIIFRNYREKVKINKVLDKQHAEIESLILNILPKEIAKELQAEGQATPRYYEQASVLFTDFKGFTSISQGLTPNELVDHLNSFFHAFDDIMEAYNIEKIKTIGDAYMCAAGIPMPNKTHPIDIVKAGLAIQEYISKKNKELEANGEPPWNLRVGIHTGPVVAGVVGKKKYAYDVWGSTVNIASRMESNGEIGKVNISEDTYNLVKDKYNCLHRGKIMAKNVGEIDMYFIENEVKEDEKVESLEMS